MKSYIYRTLTLCGFYALTSILFSLTAKFLFSIFKFKDTLLVLLYESTFNIILCIILQLYNHQKQHDNDESISENIQELLKDTLFKRSKTLIYSITYLSQVFCGMKALSQVNIPMFNTLRRTLIFFVYIVTVISGKRGRSVTSVFGLSVMLITTGALVAGYDHFEEEYFGYCLVLVTNLLTALTLHLSNSMKGELNPIELVYQNSFNMWPILFIAVIISDEFYEILSYENLYSTEFIVCLNMMALFGFLNAFATNGCAMEISPIAIAITHTVKDIFSTIISIFLFNDIQLDVLLLTGFSVSFLGSILYTYSKLSELQQDQKDQDRDEKQREQDYQKLATEES